MEVHFLGELMRDGCVVSTTTTTTPSLPPEIIPAPNKEINNPFPHIVKPCMMCLQTTIRLKGLFVTNVDKQTNVL